MDGRAINCLRSSAGILAGCPGGRPRPRLGGHDVHRTAAGTAALQWPRAESGHSLYSRTSLPGNHHGSAGTAHLWQIAGGGHADLQPWTFPANDWTVVVRL